MFVASGPLADGAASAAGVCKVRKSEGDVVTVVVAVVVTAPTAGATVNPGIYDTDTG